MKKTSLCGIDFNVDTMQDLLCEIEKSILSNNKTNVYTPNAEILYKCVIDKDYYYIIKNGDIILPDGDGVLKISNILDRKIDKKIPGVVFGEEVLKLASKNGYKVFLLGGKEGIADKAKENLILKYPTLNIVGTNNGYFDKTGSETTKIVDKINDSGADILLICLGFPTQEIWASQNKNVLNTKINLCLGGSLDVYSGTVKRAPKIFIKLKLEWFYRLIKNPSRLSRMMNIPRLFKIVKNNKEKYKGENIYES